MAVKYMVEWFYQGERQGQRQLETQTEDQAHDLIQGMLRYELHDSHRLTALSDSPDVDLSEYWMRWNEIKRNMESGRVDYVKDIRQNLRAVFGTPKDGYKFSVRDGGGSTFYAVDVGIMVTPFQMAVSEKDAGYMQMNNMYPENEYRLTANGRALYTLVCEICNYRQVNRADPYFSDYPDCNYYLSVYLGRHDKNAEVKEV